MYKKIEVRLPTVEITYTEALGDMAASYVKAAVEAKFIQEREWCEKLQEMIETMAQEVVKELPRPYEKAP